MVDDPIKVCPKCGEPKAKRLISGGNFLLKGDGWYKDLYHKPAAKKASGESTSSSSDSSSSSSESKPAAASESKPASEAKPAAGSSKSD